MTLNVPWGDGGDSGLGTRIRVFGNFIEYVPLILILLALIELSGGEMRVLHGAGTSLIAARLVHAISLQEGENPLWRKVGRGLGAMGTWLILVGLSVYALYLSQS